MYFWKFRFSSLVEGSKPSVPGFLRENPSSSKEREKIVRKFKIWEQKGSFSQKSVKTREKIAINRHTAGFLFTKKVNNSDFPE